MIARASHPRQYFSKKNDDTGPLPQRILKLNILSSTSTYASSRAPFVKLSIVQLSTSPRKLLRQIRIDFTVTLSSVSHEWTSSNIYSREQQALHNPLHLSSKLTITDGRRDRGINEANAQLVTEFLCGYAPGFSAKIHFFLFCL